MKLSPFQKEHKKNLKKNSKKELISLCMANLDMCANLMNRAEISEKMLKMTETHLEIAEKELVRKEEIIHHKDKLLKALINS